MAHAINTRSPARNKAEDVVVLLRVSESLVKIAPLWNSACVAKRPVHQTATMAAPPLAFQSMALAFGSLAFHNSRTVR